MADNIVDNIEKLLRVPEVVPSDCPEVELSMKPGYIAVNQKSKSRIQDGLRMQDVRSTFEPLSGTPVSQVTVGVLIISLMKPFL